MPEATKETVTFVLCGPNRGRSGVWGGRSFADGRCEVPASDVEAAKRILCRYHNAHPEHAIPDDADDAVPVEGSGSDDASDQTPPKKRRAKADVKREAVA